MMDITDIPVSSGTSLMGDSADATYLRSTRLRSSRLPAVPGRVAARLPRDGGTKGGGTIRMSDRSVLEAVISEMEFLASGEEKSPEASDSAQRRPSIGGSRKDGGAPRSSGGLANQPNAAEAGDIRMTQEERKRAEIFSKWEKTEALRARDQKDVLERVERGHEWREERFKRMLHAVTGSDNLAYKTAIALRERETHEEQRRRELHAAWENKVHAPLANQAHERMNPPNRALQQKLMGSRSVEIRSPEEEYAKFALVENVADNPARKPVVDLAKENAFHQAATSVLRGSQSAPDLRKYPCPPEVVAPWPGVMEGGFAPMRSSVVPRAVSRPVLEPMSWGQKDIQGTMFGHFAQAAEYGPGFRRGVRGGKDVHIPNSRDDGVLVAGSRKSRITGGGDVGILTGDTAASGESFAYKRDHGSGSGAPMQDHYTYETGTKVTDLEFPLGKRMFPGQAH
eukprot:TRINITY_DN18967_c0_g1_i1.p1 TRINITY_DN18967_c0_g1~~TRINITY_DN18967_c0_g1_i1.p1  ORF type:complete len:454 (-),score=90.20 TRINITY_DN18967_c0_g1_i1:215-1576(-)